MNQAVVSLLLVVRGAFYSMLFCWTSGTDLTYCLTL